jgi:hypothetical protein
MSRSIVRVGNDEEVLMDHDPNIKFLCNSGSTFVKCPTDNYHDKINQEIYEENCQDWYKQKYGKQNQCYFFLWYRRSDPDDINSNYILEQYNPVHNHPINYEILLPRLDKKNIWFNKQERMIPKDKV